MRTPTLKYNFLFDETYVLRGDRKEVYSKRFCGIFAHLTGVAKQYPKSEQARSSVRATHSRAAQSTPELKTGTGPLTDSLQQKRPGNPAFSNVPTTAWVRAYSSASSSGTGRSTSSTMAMGALSPVRKPHFNIRRYPPGRSS